MKRISLNVKIIIALIVLYLITYNFFLSLGVNSTIYNMLLYIALYICY